MLLLYYIPMLTVPHARYQAVAPIWEYWVHRSAIKFHDRQSWSLTPFLTYCLSQNSSHNLTGDLSNAQIIIAYLVAWRLWFDYKVVSGRRGLRVVIMVYRCSSDFVNKGCQLAFCFYLFCSVFVCLLHPYFWRWIIFLPIDCLI